MDLPCDICFNNFDLEQRQPKSLPCGHTICKECVMNPSLGGKCPTCRKDLAVDPSTLPQNIYFIQLLANMIKPSLQATGDLENKADGGAYPAARAPYVGPPGVDVLTIGENDLDGGRLKVDDILRDERRWRDARSVKMLRGTGCEDLLRVLAPQLEELIFAKEAKPGPSVMEAVREMKSLRILRVKCVKDSEDYPDLPLQLEELFIRYPSEVQLRCLQHMPGLRSLEIRDYLYGPEVSFPPSVRGGLLWLCVGWNKLYVSTMLSLIRAHAASLQELQVGCLPEDDGKPNGFFFPDLPERLAASGLVSLRRLVLRRPKGEKCAKTSACLLQLRAFRARLPATVIVSCRSCQ